MKILLLVISFACILTSESKASILFLTHISSQDSVASAGDESKAGAAADIVTAYAAEELSTSVAEQPEKNLSPVSNVTPVRNERSSLSETSKTNSRKVTKRDAKIKYELRKVLVNKKTDKQKFVFHSRKTLKDQNRFKQQRRTQNQYRQNKRIK